MDRITTAQLFPKKRRFSRTQRPRKDWEVWYWERRVVETKIRFCMTFVLHDIAEDSDWARDDKFVVSLFHKNEDTEQYN